MPLGLTPASPGLPAPAKAGVEADPFPYSCRRRALREAQGERSCGEASPLLSILVRKLAEAAAEVGDGGDPSEERLDIVDAGLLKEVRAGLVGRVLEQDSEIFEEEAV